MKYESVPVIVEAEQLLPGKDVHSVFTDNSGEHYVITIQEQKVFVNHGEWIIMEEDGVHSYPCKDNIFTKKYKLVEEHKTEHKPEHQTKK